MTALVSNPDPELDQEQESVQLTEEEESSEVTAPEGDVSRETSRPEIFPGELSPRETSELFSDPRHPWDDLIRFPRSLTGEELNTLADTRDEEVIQDSLTSFRLDLGTIKGVLKRTDNDYHVGFTPLLRPETGRYVWRQGPLRDPYIDGSPSTLTRLDDDEEPQEGETVIVKEVTTTSDYRDIRRLDTGEVLGTVKGRFELLQNETAFDFADQLVAEGRAVYIGAGQQFNGRTMLVLMELNPHVDNPFIEGETFMKYLLLRNGYDGYTPITASIIAYHNDSEVALPLDLARAPWRWTIKHTKRMYGYREEADKATKMIDAYDEQFPLALKALEETLLTDQQAKRIVTFAVERYGVGSKSALINGIMKDYHAREEVGTGLSLVLGSAEYFNYNATRRGANSRLDSLTLTYGEGFRVINTIAKQVLSSR